MRGRVTATERQTWTHLSNGTIFAGGNYEHLRSIFNRFFFRHLVRNFMDYL